ncbi:hypothetical protein MLD38_022265 [Melastoma candidum]|uniref:Uncharacterized protein n=1 Tax=Melastoma candidum TaxID=119954 RepID=A0ACB9QM43_9MYRT|nr:hypothetical protein MLD38_022265 [Melastoma candidum]
MKAFWELVWDNLTIISCLAIVLFLYSFVAYFMINMLIDSFEDWYDSGARCENHGMSPEEVRELPWFDYCQGRSCAVCLDGIRSGEMCRVFPPADTFITPGASFPG